MLFGENWGSGENLFYSNYILSKMTTKVVTCWFYYWPKMHYHRQDILSSHLRNACSSKTDEWNFSLMLESMLLKKLKRTKRPFTTRAHDALLKPTLFSESLSDYKKCFKMLSWSFRSGVFLEVNYIVIPPKSAYI